MFTAALFTAAKDGNNPNVRQLMNEQNVLYPLNGVLFSHTKD